MEVIKTAGGPQSMLLEQHVRPVLRNSETLTRCYRGDAALIKKYSVLNTAVPVTVSTIEE